MATGDRIRFFRNLRGMTQKYLGQLAGFPERTADIRMAQYEAGTRTPKQDLTRTFAAALEVSPLALNVPDIDSYYGLMHTLFALEDLYGLTVAKEDGSPILHFDAKKGREAANVAEMVSSWCEMAAKLREGSISREEYDQWRYNYPEYDAYGKHVKVPSQDLSDAIVKSLKKKLKD